ncbi:hypothetical protein WX45_01939 [Clostridium ljungdahlii DSM 13528]|uniref:Uncharacterized protein n=2 Tax=Clostridium ljungdahlii TaxID=1538 RepID=A0ABX2TNV0_CLOLD|nr:hypothetical protein WX45_01939 [Clostridium ljungdahlii DSM 13528]
MKKFRDMKQIKTQVKKPISKEEKFNLMMKEFKKKSNEIIKDSQHKKHTKSEEHKLKIKINTNRKLKNAKK